MNLLAELLGNKNWINSLGAPRAPFAASYGVLRKNYDGMLAENKRLMHKFGPGAAAGTDDYYHARGAYENGQKGLMQGIGSQIWGVGKEAKDIWDKAVMGENNPYKLGLAEILADSGKDLKNNWNGFIMGYRNPRVWADDSEYLNGKKTENMKK